jgi:hypothetical protein
MESVRSTHQYSYSLSGSIRRRGNFTFAPVSGRSSQTPGLGNSSPEKAPRTVLEKQMIQTRTMIAVRTSAITRKNAESSSAPNVIVAEATPPEELCVSMLVASKNSRTIEHTNWVQKGPPADVEGKPQLQTQDRSYSEAHPRDSHGPDDKSHYKAHDIEYGTSL